MPVIIVFKSVTYAQKAKRFLERKGIGGGILKAPFGNGIGSCAHGLKINQIYLNRALEILNENGIPYAFVVREDRGVYKKVAL